MSDQEYIIQKSALQKARDNADSVTIKSFYETAAGTIKKGGVVKIRRQFSNASEEIEHVLDSKEQLDHYFSDYS